VAIIFKRIAHPVGALQPPPGAAVELLAMHSSDAGRTWSRPRRIGSGRNIVLTDPERGTQIRGAHGGDFNATAARGEIAVAWSDIRSPARHDSWSSASATADGRGHARSELAQALIGRSSRLWRSAGADSSASCSTTSGPIAQAIRR
jgi:hypothetical protein